MITDHRNKQATKATHAAPPRKMALPSTNALLQEPKYLGILAAFIAFLILLQKHSQARSSRLPLPPKPPGWLPILGNTHDFIPAAKKGQMHTLLQKWASECGEIMRVQVGPTTNYYLNSDRAVKAIMDKAAALTSERPRWIVSNEQLCNQWNVLLLNGSDPRWKVSG